MKKYSLVKLLSKAIKISLVGIFITHTIAIPVSAYNERSGALDERSNIFDERFFQNNNIIYYDPVSNSCTQTGGGGIITGNNKDYKNRDILTEDQLQRIKEHQPTYEKASQETRIPWQVFAVVHLRESDLKKFNPSNGQGIYQDFHLYDGPYPHNGGAEVSDKEFLRQTVNAGKHLLDKIEYSDDITIESVESGDHQAIKELFFLYNGAADVYKEQAARLGYPPGPDGSPYVMNKADEKRDPETNPSGWGQIKLDGGDIEFPANSDYGAFVVYSALTSVPTSTGACIGRVLGAGLNGWMLDAMEVYYQTEPPWSEMYYGNGSMLECGCGPTSIAMAIASLTGNEAATPKDVGDIMAASDGQTSGCGSWLPGPSRAYTQALSAKYGVAFTELGMEWSNAEAAIRRGSFVVVSTNILGGHVILIRGITDDGRYLVADPSNPDNTNNENGLSKADIMLDNGFWEVKRA